MSLQSVEAAAAAVAVAPRVSIEDIKAAIAKEKFVVEDTLTICILTLKNGFVVTGESAAASPENFNPQVGMTMSRDRAMTKIWPLLGYELRTQLQNAAAAVEGVEGVAGPRLKDASILILRGVVRDLQDAVAAIPNVDRDKRAENFVNNALQTLGTLISDETNGG